MSERAIFLIEDNAAFRALLLEYLSTLGYEVHAFASGEEVLRCIARETSPIPELVISDIHMEQLTGFQLVTELRQRTPDLPAILMTGFGNPELERRALDEGAAYVEKPFQLPVIQDLVQKLLGDHR